MEKKYPGRTTTIAQHPAMKKRIMVIDDDEGIRDIFRIVFEKAGYSLEIKENGNEILENKFRLPDLFLIDKQISGIDGLDLCRHLKDREQTKDIPVIMISAAPDIGLLAQKAGADDYIEKPFQISQLLKTVENYIRKAQAKKPARRTSV